MPNPVTPAVAGLQTALAPEALIKQRQAVNSTMSGATKPGPATLPAPKTSFQLNPQLPDPEGMLQALKANGYRGQRLTDIELSEPQQSVDQLKARIDALMGASR